VTKNKLHKPPEGKKKEQNRGEKTLVAGKKLDWHLLLIFFKVTDVKKINVLSFSFYS
jgi:hypothetical protein